MSDPRSRSGRPAIFRGQPLQTKVLVMLVAGIGIASLAYGVYSIREQVVGPFRLSSFDEAILSELVPTNPADEVLSRTTDTDGDGLSDYDEVALYTTSPYLPDSDSDGVTDAAEIEAGTDPNCKPGESCGSLRLVTPDTKISDLFPQFSGSDITLRDKTLKEFRQILLDQGYDKESLDQISDDALLVILEESLKLQDQDVSTSTPTSTDPIGQEEYDNLRLLLIELGVPRDEVYSLSNEDVQEILRTFQ